MSGLRIDRPESGSGAPIPPFGSREENSETDREGDSAPHPLGGAGGPHQSAESTTRPKPRMGLYRDGATLYKCTPMETAALTSLPYYTPAGSRLLSIDWDVLIDQILII